MRNLQLAIKLDLPLDEVVEVLKTFAKTDAILNHLDANMFPDWFAGKKYIKMGLERFSTVSIPTNYIKLSDIKQNNFIIHKHTKWK